MKELTQRIYKHYIFDCDYTLFDTSGGMGKCYEEALKAIGVPYDSGMLDTYVKESLKATFGRYDVKFNVSKSLDDKTHENSLNGNEANFPLFEEVFLKNSKVHMCELTKIYPETSACLEYLHKNNKIISIVTGKPKERVIEILKKFNLDSYVKEIVGYGEYQHAKPDPESLNMCMERVDVPREMSVYIGDSVYDIEAAKNAGIDGILIDRSGKNSKAIKGLDELIK